MGILDQYGQTVVRSPGSKAMRIVAFRGTTDGSGNLTMAAGSDYDQQLSVTRSVNNYVVNLGPYKNVLASIARSATTTSSGITEDAANGLVTINFGSNQANGVLHVTLVVDQGYGG